jgi:hypothetical protein
LIVYHLAAIAIPILDTPSGPWPDPLERGVADAPAFAHSAAWIATVHGKYLRVAHSYHFISNSPSALPGVQFEVRLKDGKGDVIDTLHFPDPHANPWLRHRQELLAASLAPDFPVEAPGGEVVAAEGKVPTVPFWALPGEKPGVPLPQPPAGKVELRFAEWPQHLLPRNRGGVMRPSPWALVLVRSCARYQCRSHGAATAEIVRHTREPLSPDLLSAGNLPPAFEDLVATFGNMPPLEETAR